MLISQNPALNPGDIIKDDWDLIGEIDVEPQPEPGSRDTLVVGEYEATMPEPVLLLDVEPDPNKMEDAFVADLHRIDEGDTYRLVYFFGNFGGPTYHVKVWERVG